MNASEVLRPVHAWFFLWERRLPSIYRVVATGLAALVTASPLIAAGAHPLLAAVLSLPLWVGLAVAQEHDERVLLSPDEEFVSALAAALSRPPLGLVVDEAHGPRRARPEAWDTFVQLSVREPPTDGPTHPLASMYIALERSAAEGWMRLDVIDDAPGDFESIDERLAERGERVLVERIREASSPAADAEAIARALIAAYP